MATLYVVVKYDKLIEPNILNVSSDLYFPCLNNEILDVNMADILVCSFILELPLCKYLCIWITCICWVRYVCFSFRVPSSPFEWAASRLHSLVGCEHVYFQCGICICELETWQGIFLYFRSSI